MEKGNRIINKIKLLMCVLCLFLLFGCKQRPEEVINTLKESISAWQEQYDLGVRYLLEGNYEEAIIAFSSAVEIDPKKLEAYLERANAYIESAGLKTTDQQEELYEKALADLEKAEELGDGKATEEIEKLQNIAKFFENYKGKADEFLEKGDIDSALKYMRKAYARKEDKTLFIQIQALQNGGAQQMDILYTRR